ncbi:MAG: ribonuclease PH [Candidatus Saganbacteria bacterium]|uniref:dITP/XTP pyrophosphatase n=1 Tax=Candidatus Saganbacteria bacterium TaxID=2575572 RepID=A0A833NXD9_UNCSA|nr:MAG: ribonuclease PH [Candidatus Saganbacteria bacterium]
MNILLATSNKHKLEEIRHILKVSIEGCSLNVKEDGTTFEENAVKKAKTVSKKFKCIAIADDSGLMVDSLNGAPGVKSARYASPPTPENLCGKLLNALKDSKNRKAKFVSVIAIAYPDGKTKTFRGEVKGNIIKEMRGEHGFGYDPVFVPIGYKKTFAEMKPAFKNKISHRHEALIKLKGKCWR